MINRPPAVLLEKPLTAAPVTVSVTIKAAGVGEGLGAGEGPTGELDDPQPTVRSASTSSQRTEGVYADERGLFTRRTMRREWTASANQGRLPYRVEGWWLVFAPIDALTVGGNVRGMRAAHYLHPIDTKFR